MGQTLIPDPAYRTPGGVASTSAQQVETATANVKVIVSYVVPANTFALGTTYRLIASGTVTTSATSPTMNWSVRIGGTTLATTQVPSTATGVTDRGWSCAADLTCRTVGASGKFVGGITLLNEISTTITAAVNVDSPVVNAGTFITTNALTIDLVMFFGAALAGNTLRAEIGTIELVRL